MTVTGIYRHWSIWLLIRGFFTLALLTIPTNGNATGRTNPDETNELLSLYLRQRLTARHTSSSGTIPTEDLKMEHSVSIFYARRTYRPAWSRDTTLIPQVDVLVSILRDAEREGLDPHDYHVTQIVKSVATLRSFPDPSQTPSIDEFGRLDLLLTDAFLLYGSHVLNGRVSPRVENGIWGLKPDKVDLVTTLEVALDRGDLASAIRALHPTHPSYTGLQQTLARYREIAITGGWPFLPPGPTLRQGVQDPQVFLLRARLYAEGYLSHDTDKGDAMFDVSLDQAVRTFQQHHGLDDDGVVGSATRATLNISIDARIQQLALNMERWRWLPREVESPAVIVNIAGFTLEVMETQAPVLTMKIIIGKPYTRTPLFHTKITAVELNPAWHIPSSIATKELLPLIRKDPHYLARHHMSVVRDWSDANSIDPMSINWRRLSARSFPYHLRQEPGPWNALGQIKFHLPSPFSIYLHDTPAQSLFTHTIRAFSHGCIRIEKPLDLAVYLLRDAAWTRNALQEAIEHDTRTTIQLSRPVPVYIGYWTAWVEQDGTAHFRPDLYGRDRHLSSTLRFAFHTSNQPTPRIVACP